MPATCTPSPFIDTQHTRARKPLQKNAFHRYRHYLIDSLRLDKVRHWDPELRRLSALALGNMAMLEPAYAAETVLPAVLGDTLSPDLLRRHGACLAASEMTLALGKV